MNITFSIPVPPTIETQPTNGQVVVKKGTTIDLKCKARGNPQPVLHWSKANDQMPQKYEVSDDDEVQALTRLFPFRLGKYSKYVASVQRLGGAGGRPR